MPTISFLRISKAFMYLRLYQIYSAQIFPIFDIFSGYNMLKRSWQLTQCSFNRQSNLSFEVNYTCHSYNYFNHFSIEYSTFHCCFCYILWSFWKSWLELTYNFENAMEILEFCTSCKFFIFFKNILFVKTDSDSHLYIQYS